MRQFILWVSAALLSIAAVVTPGKIATDNNPVSTPETDRFETAIEIIKKYEGLHSPKHWPLVGYGHKVLPGESFPRNRALTQPEAEKLLRQDFQKFCKLFRSYGKDSILMAALAYNIGNGAAERSSVARKLKAGDRDIRDNYIAHSRYRGKIHPQIQKRRIEEFERLFVSDTLQTAKLYNRQSI